MLIINPNVGTVQSKCEPGPAPGFSCPFLGLLALGFCLNEARRDNFYGKKCYRNKIELKFEKATTGPI